MSEDPKGGGSPPGDVIKPAGSNAAPATSIDVDIDGKQKSFTADDVKNLVSQQASATQKTQDVASIIALAERHKIPVAELAPQIDGLFGRVTELMDKGILDDEGQLIERTPSAPAPVIPDNNTNFGFSPEPSPSPIAGSGPEQAAQAALESLKSDVKEMKEGYKKMESSTAMLLEGRVKGKILEANPEFSDRDAAHVLNKAQGDTSKTLEQHIEAHKTTKTDYETSQREKFAKEFGIDLPTFNENRLHEQDAKGGGFGGFFKGKKFSFKKGGEDTVNPRKAMEEALKANIGG